MMAFIEQDARLGEQRNAAHLAAMQADGDAFSEAVKSVVPEDAVGGHRRQVRRVDGEHGGPTGLMHPEDGSLGEEDDLEA